VNTNILRAICATGIAVVGQGTAQHAIAQTELAIRHEALECLSSDEFPLVDANIDPHPDVRTAKVYFRSDKYPDFYYVIMELPPKRPEEDFFLGVLPKPSPETERIIYYVEAVSAAFNSERSEEHDPLVDEECDRDPAAAYWAGQDPGIIVGATTAGATALPPGFQAVGIVGTIASTGAASGVGGGTSLAAVVGVSAGAAGVGAIIVASGGGETTSSAPPAAPPTGASPTTTAVVVGSPSSVTTTVPPSGGSTTSVPPGPTTTTVTGGPTTTTVTGGPTTTTIRRRPHDHHRRRKHDDRRHDIDFDDNECRPGERVLQRYLSRRVPPAAGCFLLHRNDRQLRLDPRHERQGRRPVPSNGKDRGPRLWWQQWKEVLQGNR
jgi:hypothetical protein